MKYLKLFIILFLSIQSYAQSQESEFQNINPNIFLFGHEATFQNFEISRQSQTDNTCGSPEKKKRALLMIKWLSDLYGEKNFSLLEDTSYSSFKPAWLYEVTEKADVLKRKNKIKLDMEPQTVEVVQEPMHLNQLAKGWKPIFDAAASADMVGSVYASGYKSGSGHFHVGFKDQKDNVFKTNPIALRNLLVFFHNNPALLYGFASGFEAGTAGVAINEFPFADVLSRHDDFSKLIIEFDEWYLKQEDRKKLDSDAFVTRLRNSSVGRLFFGHDIFINLEHFLRSRGTVEFRNIRPMQSAKEVEAMGYLLLKITDYAAGSDLIPLSENKETIAQGRFYSPMYIEENWRKLVDILKLKESFKRQLTRMVESVTKYGNYKTVISGELTIREALQKDNQLKIEISRPLNLLNANEDIVYEGESYKTFTVVKNRKKYQVAVINSSGRSFVNFRTFICKVLFN